VYPDKGMTIALLRKADIKLELFMFKSRKPLPRYRQTLDRDLRTLGMKHFSVEVPNISKIFQKFKESKVSFATDLRVFDNGAQYFFIKDPDGILVEIMERQ
jgi:glyoxylase I family protein